MNVRSASFVGTLLLVGIAGAGQVLLVSGSDPQGTSKRQQQGFGRTTGLIYAEKGLRSPPHATRRGYRVVHSRARKVVNLGAAANTTQIAQIACGKDSITDAECADVLLPALTPAAYSSNNTADTPGRRAFISPAQNQGAYGACVGFAVTAAAEAAINVHLGQNWNRLSLSEQSLSFCRLWPRINCDFGASYDSVVMYLSEQGIRHWPSRECFPYTGAPSDDCSIAGEEF